MEHKKYQEVETVIAVVFFLGADVAAAIIDATGIGLAIAPLLQTFGTGVMLLLAWSKGDKQALKTGRAIAKFAVNAVPILPTLTTVFLIERYIHNHPESFAAKTATKAAGAASGKPGAATGKISK